MGEDQYIRKTDKFIRLINSYSVINEEGLKNADFPDRNIMSLHNHIGNVKQHVSGITVAMNGADQSLTLKDAEKELTEAMDDIFVLHQRGVITDSIYFLLNKMARDLEKVLSIGSDQDYL